MKLAPDAGDLAHIANGLCQPFDPGVPVCQVMPIVQLLEKSHVRLQRFHQVGGQRCQRLFLALALVHDHPRLASVDIPATQAHALHLATAIAMWQVRDAMVQPLHAVQHLVDINLWERREQSLGASSVPGMHCLLQDGPDDQGSLPCAFQESSHCAAHLRYSLSVLVVAASLVPSGQVG